MNFNPRQKLIIKELNLEKKLEEIENLQNEIELIETKNEKLENIVKVVKTENSLEENLETKKQKLKLLRSKLIEKIQKNWQNYNQKTEIQKFCPYVQIKLCDGICGHLESLENYNTKIDQIKTVLGGKIKSAKLFLEDNIQDAINQENYPLAALWRDRIKSLEDLTIDQNVIFSSDLDLDLFTLVIDSLENGLVLGSVFVQNIREGKIVNVSNYLLSESIEEEIDKEENEKNPKSEFKIESKIRETTSEMAFSFWQRFLSSYVASSTNLAPVILQTFWSEKEI